MADTHFLISKVIDAGRTRTELDTLDHNEKIKEIGRMISGAEITELTKEHAQELLELAYTIKST